MEPEVDFDGWLLVCTEASVLEAYGDTWRFSHDKLREAIQKSLSHDLHHALHRRVAEAMETVYPDPNVHAAALAHHWLVAGDREKELHYTVIAAEQAASSNVGEEANALFKRAEELRLAQGETAGGDAHPDAA
jgi:predicted ATPase